MTQQRVLETLKARVARGERPLVRAGDDDYSFSMVVWGGSSPLVQLRDPAGNAVSKTAAEWTRAGAKFAARSRDLAKSSAKKTKKSKAQLDAEVAALVSDPGPPRDANGFTAKQRAAQAEIKIGAIPGSEWTRARVAAILREMDTAALRSLMHSHLTGAGIFTAGRQVAAWAGEILSERGA